MNCFSQRVRRTAPMRGSSRNELVPSKPPRKNGWSWPPQPFQVVGWLVYSYLTIVSFGICIPLLPLPWKHVAYTVSLTHSWNLAVIVADYQVCSSGSFLFEYGANISLCCGCWTGQGFCCVARLYGLHLHPMWLSFSVLCIRPQRHHQWSFC